MNSTRIGLEVNKKLEFSKFSRKMFLDLPRVKTSKRKKYTTVQEQELIATMIKIEYPVKEETSIFHHDIFGLLDYLIEARSHSSPPPSKIDIEKNKNDNEKILTNVKNFL